MKARAPSPSRIGDAGQAFLDQRRLVVVAVGQGLGEFVDPAHDASDSDERSMP